LIAVQRSVRSHPARANFEVAFGDSAEFQNHFCFSRIRKQSVRNLSRYHVARARNRRCRFMLSEVSDHFLDRNSVDFQKLIAHIEFIFQNRFGYDRHNQAGFSV
jgi:hypothetical protein